jgi:hypothetical protein
LSWDFPYQKNYSGRSSGGHENAGCFRKRIPVPSRLRDVFLGAVQKQQAIYVALLYGSLCHLAA